MNLNAATGLVGHELIHLSLTSLISFFIYRRYHNWKLIIICFIFGFFIDIDHWFDYFLYFGTNFNLKNFFNVTSYVKTGGKVYIPLHGWEYIIIFAFLGRIIEKITKIPGIMWAVVFSYSAHLIFDNFSFPHHILSYSFIYRISNHFSQVSFDVPK